MKETRTVKVTSGKYEAELVLTKEQYDDYMRPWWRQKQKAKRNREAIEENGYTFTSYEEWSCGSGANLSGYDSFEEEVIHKEKLEFLRKVLATFTEEEKQIALQILSGDVTVTQFAKDNGMKRTTVSDKKSAVLVKLQTYFKKNGYEI